MRTKDRLLALGSSHSSPKSRIHSTGAGQWGGARIDSASSRAAEPYSAVASALSPRRLTPSSQSCRHLIQPKSLPRPAEEEKIKTPHPTGYTLRLFFLPSPKIQYVLDELGSFWLVRDSSVGFTVVVVRPSAVFNCLSSADSLSLVSSVSTANKDMITYEDLHNLLDYRHKMVDVDDSIWAEILKENEHSSCSPPSRWSWDQTGNGIYRQSPCCFLQPLSAFRCSCHQICINNETSIQYSLSVSSRKIYTIYYG